MPSSFVAVTGLPRAGSTLLCQLLAQHPEIDCEGMSSPLCNLLLGVRPWRAAGRGRDASYLTPPAQIRTCSTTAYGSYHKS